MTHEQAVRIWVQNANERKEREAKQPLLGLLLILAVCGPFWTAVVLWLLS